MASPPIELLRRRGSGHTGFIAPAAVNPLLRLGPDAPPKEGLSRGVDAAVAPPPPFQDIVSLCEVFVQKFKWLGVDDPQKALGHPSRDSDFN